MTLIKYLMPALYAGVLCVPAVRGAAQRQAERTWIWPNAVSSANSDDWLISHHDSIRQMRPRLLVLNFANGVTPDGALTRVKALMAALRESSRYHGYADPQAQPFLDYQLVRIVDLTDSTPPADPLDGNSTRYPRVPDWTSGINFRYGELFGDQFAEWYGFRDPMHPTRFLTLSDLVNRGMVNEVWFIAKQGQYGAPFECTEVKQAYDSALNKIAGHSVQAGNGGTDEQPFVGRSLRILFMNADRGPGCAMESLGHAIEGTSNSHAIPYFTRYFTEYAGFDLDRRFKLPFNSFYGRDGAELSYPDSSTLKLTFHGQDYTIHPYIPIGGSVHFMLTARHDYDLDNPVPILSTIEHYRLHDGPGGRDRAEVWTNARFAAYRQLASDCQGPWLVYWRQNMPGYGNRCVDSEGGPMKNWWPFLFY